MKHYHVYPFPDRRPPFTAAETAALDAAYHHELAAHPEDCPAGEFFVGDHDHDEPVLQSTAVAE